MQSATGESRMYQLEDVAVPRMQKPYGKVIARQHRRRKTGIFLAVAASRRRRLAATAAAAEAHKCQHLAAIQSVNRSVKSNAGEAIAWRILVA